MLRKKIEKGDLTKCIYESSTILASTYNKETKDLTIIFTKGGSYTYASVKGTDYLRFETDESQGRILNSHIKQYTFIKNENVDVEPIKAQLETAINEDKAKIAKEMVESMKNLIQVFEGESDSSVGFHVLTDVEAHIKLFKEANRIVDVEQ